MRDGLITFVGFLVAIWLCGILFFLWAVHVTRPRMGTPLGWPWCLPIWPLMLLREEVGKWRQRRRLSRMKAEVWRR